MLQVWHAFRKLNYNANKIENKKSADFDTGSSALLEMITIRWMLET